MAGQPKLTQALHPIHLVESTWRGLLYFLNALRSSTQGPSLMIREGSSFSSSSLFTFSVSSRFHGFTFLGVSIPRTRPNSTKSIRWAFSPRMVYPVAGCSCWPVIPVVRLSEMIIVVYLL